MEPPKPTIDVKQTMKTVGDTLIAFSKSGPRYPNHRENVASDIAISVRQAITSSQISTAAYERVCRTFLEQVLEIKGLPIRAIGGEWRSGVSGETFARLLPSILRRFDWCITNFRSQATLYLNREFASFESMLQSILNDIPDGGNHTKIINTRIATLKNELRALLKWNKLFYIYKAQSFPVEVEYLFTLEEYKPIAAVWRYSALDEDYECEDKPDHRLRNGRTYTIRGNWVVESAMMKVGADGFLDAISMPGQDVGCSCSLQW